MNDTTLLKSYIRLVLESLPAGGHGIMTNVGMNGNSIQSPDDIQYGYEDTEGVDIEIYPTADGKTHVQIVSLVDDKLSSPARVFTNEEEAKNFARIYVEKIKRIMMSMESF